MKRTVEWFWIVLISWMTLLFAAHAAEYRYSYVPKSVYTTQVFPITLQAIDADPSQPVRFHFDPHAPLQPLSSTPGRLINGNDIFYTFYFQSQNDNDLILPNLTIEDANQTHQLRGKRIHIQSLDTRNAEHFCGLMATSCTVRASQVSMFDANTTLVSMTIEAHEGNPEAITIPGALEQGIEKIDRKNSIVTAEFYFVIPSAQKSVTLSYYNTAQRRFIPIHMVTDYHAKPVAAQVELNPKVSPFDQLKRYGTLALTLFFAVMFRWRRDWIYLVLLVVVGVLLLTTLYQPRPILCIQEGSELLILPTHNSRSSTTVTEQLETPSIGEHGAYHKIKYHNGIIGWIRDEDLCPN